MAAEFSARKQILPAASAGSARSRERFLLLTDLRRQLPRTRGNFRDQTERAIRRLEHELAGGRDLAQKAATR